MFPMENMPILEFVMKIQFLQILRFCKGRYFVWGFRETIAYASPDALFYFDPPYKPLSKTSSFNSYAKDEFDDNEQIRLRDFCHKIVQYKTNFILSNSDVKGKDENDNFFDEIYNEYHIQRVMATRMVNANPEKRGKLSELMISNISMNYR